MRLYGGRKGGDNNEPLESLGQGLKVWQRSDKNQPKSEGER
jgi:hypothetical protein